MRPVLNEMAVSRLDDTTSMGPGPQGLTNAAIAMPVL